MINRIYRELSSLLYCRFTKEELDDRLSEIFGEKITSVINDEENLIGDYCLFFATKGYEKETDGIGTIFYLLTRQGEFYVTETCFEPGA